MQTHQQAVSARDLVHFSLLLYRMLTDVSFCNGTLKHDQLVGYGSCWQYVQMSEICSKDGKSERNKSSQHYASDTNLPYCSGSVTTFRKRVRTESEATSSQNPLYHDAHLEWWLIGN